MAKRRTKNKEFRNMLLVGIVVFLLAAFGSYFLISKSRRAEKPVEPGSASVTLVDEAIRANVTYYLPAIENGNIYLKAHTKEATGKKSVLDLAVETLIAEGSNEWENGNVIPSGTKLLKPIAVTDGVATIDFGSDFLDNFSGGSDMESLTLNSIALTAAQADKSVRKIIILVEGKPVDSLGGHYDLSTPITPDSSLLKPGK